MTVWQWNAFSHYSDVIMGAIASQITSLTIVYSTVYSGADQRKLQSSRHRPFVWWINRGPVNSPHKGPVTWKKFLFDDAIMALLALCEKLIFVICDELKQIGMHTCCSWFQTLRRSCDVLIILCVAFSGRQGPLLLACITLIPTWISNHLASKVWDEITSTNKPRRISSHII